MYCNRSSKALAVAAEHYLQLGYQVGTSYGKELVDDHYSPFNNPKRWDSISIILDGLACVDLDRFTSLGERFVLPPTWKERSPRGLHYLYRLPARFRGTTKIGWKTNIDLLMKTASKSTPYGATAWQGHVLCSPSKGYTRLTPKAIPRKNELPLAPGWLLDYLER
jgi:hypothetical protein